MAFPIFNHEVIMYLCNSLAKSGTIFVSTWVSETNMVVSPTESKAVGSFFMVVGGRGEGWGGAEEKCGATTKNNKPIWLKRAKTVPPKIKLGPKFYIWIFFLKILFWAYNFFKFVQWTSSEIFFNFTTSSRNSQNQQKLTKKTTHFIIQFCSKNLTHFRNLNSLDTENNIVSQHNQ